MIKPTAWSTRTRQAATIGIVVMLLAVSSGAAVTMNEQKTLDLETEVLSTSDPLNVHRITEMKIRVTNEDTKRVTPLFNMIHGELQTRFYWEIESGPEHLAPGQSAVYVITAPVPQSGISYETELILAINDNGSSQERKVNVPPFESEFPSTVLNPKLENWQINPGESHFSPYRWQYANHQTGSETTAVEEVNGTSARITVNNMSRDTGSWAMSGLMQTTGFPETLHINATPSTVATGPNPYPKHPTGVEISEGDHRTWVVFADVDERKIVERAGKLDYVMVFIPAEPRENVEASIDIGSIYQEQDWEIPTETSNKVDRVEYERSTVNLLAFAAVYPGSSTDNASVEFHEISATSAQSGSENGSQEARSLRGVVDLSESK